MAGPPGKAATMHVCMGRVAVGVGVRVMKMGLRVRGLCEKNSPGYNYEVTREEHDILVFLSHTILWICSLLHCRTYAYYSNNVKRA